MMVKIIHFVLLPCSQATLLMEMQASGNISTVQKARLKAHLLICKWCRAYQRKVSLLDAFLSKKKNIKISDSNTEFDVAVFQAKVKEKLNI